MNKTHRVKRHNRIRKYLSGTAKTPRLAVFRSNKHIYAQIIDDEAGKTLVFASDAKETGTGGAKSTKSERALRMGKQLAQKALKHKIASVVFDRGGFLYHGRVEMVAKGAREEGLKF